MNRSIVCDQYNNKSVEERDKNFKYSIYRTEMHVVFHLYVVSKEEKRLFASKSDGFPGFWLIFN